MLVLAAMLALYSSCTIEQKRNADALPPARGGKGELVVVMDSAKWSTELGAAVQSVFAEPLSGMPQPEPIFSLTPVTSSQFKSILQQCRNVVIATTFDSQAAESRILQNYFTTESRQKMKEDTSMYMVKQQDVYAKGQLILYLFGETEEQLIKHLADNKEQLQQLFQERENKAVEEKLLASNALNKDLMRSVEKSHDVKLKLPVGYSVATDTSYAMGGRKAGFMWLRSDEGKLDLNLLISYRPYTSEEEFADENLIEWRNTLGKDYIYADREEKPDSYMLTEQQLPPSFKETQIAGQYAKEMRGLWRLNKVFWGGPFISYSVVSPSTGRLYYLEGFVAAPGSNKRESMRELELILKSVKFPASK